MAPKQKRAASSQPASSSKAPVTKRVKTSAPTPAVVAPAAAPLKFKSPAEFFAENKNIAGFDNPGKSLYTTLREFIENALDATEAVPVLPTIEIKVIELSVDDLDDIVDSHTAGKHGKDVKKDERKKAERVDLSIYKDVENEKEKKEREKIEAKLVAKDKRKEGKKALDIDQSGDQVDEGADVSDSPALKTETKKSAPNDQTQSHNLFRVTVTDNGTGMIHENVPNLLARVLAGTKYCVKQSRGKFGLGAKMALIWSKMSTGLPFEIKTATTASFKEPQGDQAWMTHCILDIDIAQNKPQILKHDKIPNKDKWRGTQVSVVIEGNWTTYRAKILQYLRQLAVITPYADFTFSFVAQSQRSDKSFTLHFQRRSDQMPPPVVEVKHHPSSVNQLILKQLIDQCDPSMTLSKFLTTQLTSISREYSLRLITELGEDFKPDMKLSSIDLNAVRLLDRLLKQARFDQPNGHCLSPAGEYNLRLGIMKEMNPDMLATYAEPADVFEGHPFIVEVGLSLGGPKVKQGINIFRFANRIPLLFEGGNDVITKTALKDISWSQYKISANQDKIGVYCSIVSTKIPFKGTGKEYIGDDATSIKQAVKRAITQCCLQLKVKLIRKAAMKDMADRKKNLTKYVPDVVNALISTFEGINSPTVSAEIVSKIKNKEITREQLKLALIRHVEMKDKDFAIETGPAAPGEKSSAYMFVLAKRAPDDCYVHIRDPDGGPYVGFKLLKSLQV